MSTLRPVPPFRSPVGQAIDGKAWCHTHREVVDDDDIDRGLCWAGRQELDPDQPCVLHDVTIGERQ